MAIRFYTAPFYALDNFSAHAIEIEGVIYPTAEHAYHATKFLDTKYKELIRMARSPLEAKTLANETYASARDPNWESRKTDAMELVLRAKLEQHEEVRQILKRSGSEELIEDSPDDYFWGEGKESRGQNHLGKLWMKLRAELS